MALFGGLGNPSTPPPAPPMAHPPTLGSSDIALAALEARQRSRAAEGQGFDNTIKTSPVGQSLPAKQAPSTLLGG